MLPVLLLAFQIPFALPAVLEQWKVEIEARTLNRIEMIRIPGDPIPAEDREERIRTFLSAYTRLVSEPEKTFIISALTGEGGRELTFAIMDHLQRNARTESAENAESTE